VQVEFLLDDGDEHVDRNCAPDLSLDGVLGSSEERLDTKMLLDPFEEEFDLPAAFVQLGNDQRGQVEVVGQKDEPLVGLRIAVMNAANRIGIQLRGQRPVEHDGLIAAKTRCRVDGARLATSKVEVLLGARYEEGHAASES